MKSITLNRKQIQDIVLGTVHGMLTSGDLVGNMPERDNPEGVINNTPPEQSTPMEAPAQ